MPVTNRRKVRSGCGTCRIRKVKCDEFKPVCKRCHSTGRECEGYGIWGGGGNGYAARYGSQKAHILPLQHHHPVAKLHLSTEDHVYLEWFHHRLVHDLSSRFAEGFRTELVMPALLNEPTIAHAVIALSSAHKDATLATEHTQLESERVVVAHYNRSMGQLWSALETGKETTAGLALVSCLLYTLLDRLRGRFAQAEIHLQSGLRLLRDVHQRSYVNTYAGTTLLKRSTNEDPDRVKILQGFASLHLESQLLGTDLPGMDILVQSCVEDVPRSAFQSIEQARHSLNKIIHAILLISRHALRVTIAEQEYRLSTLDARNQALCLLQAWLKTCKATSFCETKTVRDHQFARTVLFNRYDMALAMWGHIGCTSESGYISQTATFLAILERSVAMWHTLPSLSAAESTSVSDNLVTPLFFMALKCRVLLIRLQAVRLLKAIRLSAGGWSSILMANVASEVMALEQDICTDRVQRDGSQFTDISTVGGVDCMLHSSLNLIHGVAIGS